jgi:hypothetical protein
MNGLSNLNIGAFILLFLIIIPAILIVTTKKNFSITPAPKPRDFGGFLAEWAQKKGFRYTPQQISAVSGIFKNRWFAIHTNNSENALEIYMRVKNAHRHSLQIFADWLEETGVTAFINRFRIYSTPPGLGESLFESGSSLWEALNRFPIMRARMELAFDPINKDELRYSLLTDLSNSEELDIIMESMGRFCDAYEETNIKQ